MTFDTCIFCHFQELRSQFDNCLADGQPLLVTDIDVNVFKNDPRFGKVILSRTQFTVGKNPFKIPVRVVAWRILLLDLRFHDLFSLIHPAVYTSTYLYGLAEICD